MSAREVISGRYLWHCAFRGSLRVGLNEVDFLVWTAEV